jgi:hypothetical protein
LYGSEAAHNGKVDGIPEDFYFEDLKSSLDHLGEVEDPVLFEVTDPTSTYGDRIHALSDIRREIINPLKDCLWLSIKQLEVYEDHQAPDSVKQLLSKFKTKFNELSQVCENTTHDIYNLSEEMSDFAHETSEDAGLGKKLVKYDEVRYFLKRETLQPEDINIGATGGACIGIYNEVSDTNGKTPFLLLDEATVFFGIYQQLGEKEPRKVGFTLAFLTFDENFQPVLAGNSTELHTARNPHQKEILNPVVAHVHEYIKTFAAHCGIEGVSMGTHEYNTSVNYCSQKLPEFSNGDELMKLPIQDQPEFYQEIFAVEEGEYATKQDSNGWIKKP